MDFNSTEQQDLVRRMVRDFAIKEVQPIAEEIDAEGRFPYETIEKAGPLGLMGMPFPKEYGGIGADYISYIIAIEELSRVCGSTGVIVQTHCALCCWPILTYGTEEQRRKYLPDLLTGKKIGAFGLTEPNAGSDAAGTQTVAVDMGDHWRINGTKIFISGGGIAEVYVVMAMTDKSKGTKGISAFILEKGMKGFSIGKIENKMGIRGSIAAELVFEDCIVPKENLLGELGKGFKVAMSSLDVGRLGIAAQALGIAQGAYDQTVEYMKTRKQFGKELYKFQALSFEMADMRTRIDAARLLLYKAADKRQKGLPSTIEAAQAKLFCSETAMHVTTKAVQFHGGYGYIKDYPVERMMRDAKITEIYEGTSEIMKIIISGDIFK
ncbi:MAG: acyl-CoA dehydrogenase [Eubacteriales bacterium]|nr:acyl-CoA dehydrogenase [Eubacteriales bacterium]MDD3198998.1 acyl-CoA dehydrogenase [Eubacteriales bacterium]MDD4122124.1 acyl-CoA dehydrogenase [Eubacteriales bacterium]MDD4629516.1 acyl-CoA dehydrogenase [Eubacteriales bacterium]